MQTIEALAKEKGIEADTIITAIEDAVLTASRKYYKTTENLKTAIADGSLKKYVASANALYKNAAGVTLKAVDTHLQRPRLTPFGGLYTVVDIGTNAEEFVPRALKATGVLVVPGGGFGDSLKNGVRISFGPLVRDTAKIEEGLARLGTWMRSN